MCQVQATLATAFPSSFFLFFAGRLRCRRSFVFVQLANAVALASQQIRRACATHSNWTEIIRSNKFDLILYLAFCATIDRTFSLFPPPPVSWTARICFLCPLNGRIATALAWLSRFFFFGLRVISESKSICPNLNYTTIVWPAPLSQQLLLQFLSTTIWFSPRSEHEIFFSFYSGQHFWSQPLCKHFNQWVVKSTFVRVVVICFQVNKIESLGLRTIENSAKKKKKQKKIKWASVSRCVCVLREVMLTYIRTVYDYHSIIPCGTSPGHRTSSIESIAIVPMGMSGRRLTGYCVCSSLRAKQRNRKE